MYGKFLSKQRFSIIMVLCMGGSKNQYNGFQLCVYIDFSIIFLIHMNMNHR